MNDLEQEDQVGGAVETKEFYDTQGWARQGDKLLDTELFGVKEDGPIRKAGHRIRSERIRDAVRSVGDGVRLLECGCGGTPATFLLDLCSHYTGVDFSARGIEEARKAVEASGVAFEVQVADMCRLPFAPNTFDVVYSSHALYHIPDPSSQASAIAEMIRVVRPGGVIVLVVANARPLASPVRLAKRLIADTPGVSGVANRLRPPPPLPYKPMPISWMTRQFRGRASVEVTTYTIASTWINQRVSERTFVGSRMWKGMIALEERLPHLSAYLGNYVTLVARKNG